MHTKWLTYRVSWCNVRVKLGQSLWAGGALAKRLPLLQETDRQWEKKHVSQPVQWHHTFTSSAWASTVTRHHQSSPDDPEMWHHQRAWKQQQTLLTFIQNGKLPPQSQKWEKRCWIISNYVCIMKRMKWQSNHVGWIMKKRLHLIYPAKWLMMKQMQTRQKQTNMALTVCVKRELDLMCVVCMSKPHCSGSSLARPDWVKAWREICWGWPPPGSPSIQRQPSAPAPLNTKD